MLRHVLEHLRTAVRGLPTNLTDGQLLARFTGCRDEDAFATLLRRHGRMVWGVCRSTVGHAQDAEDAFQATFLALARKAGSLSGSESVGGWLYRVAFRIAVHARAANARRSSRERSVDNLPDVASVTSGPEDWYAVLHQEIAGLPDVYQQALVLCELEGVSRREGAQRLGVPEGTLSSRLAAARRLLGERLVRRGLALSAGCLTLNVPEALAVATLEAVTSQGRATPIVALAKGVLQSMFVSKFKALVALSALGLLISVGAFTYGVGGQEPTTTKAAQPESGSKSNLPAPPERPGEDKENEAEALRRENKRLQLELRAVRELAQALRDEAQFQAEKAKEEATILRLENKRLQLELLQVRKLAEEMAVEAKSFQEEALRQRDQAQQSQREAEKLRGRLLAAEQELTRLRVRSSQEAQADAEGALKAFQEAKDKEGRRKALESLQKAVDKLKETVK
jgi:RNA polymerase sigma factor (sigma-70 family)